MLRVCGSGDVFAWVVRPLLVDVKINYSGTYIKSIGGVDVVGVESDGCMWIDGMAGEIVGRTHSIGDGENREVVVTANEVRIQWDATQSSQLTPKLLSGAFTKSINGVDQAAQVIMSVNEDFSFTWSESIPSVISRIEALEAAFIELVGPD